MDRLGRDCALYQRVVKGNEDGRGKEEKQNRIEEIMAANEELERAAREKQDALDGIDNVTNDLVNTKEQNAAISVENYEMRKTIVELQGKLEFQQGQRNCLENEMTELNM